MIVNCKHCGKEFKTFPQRIKIGKAKFCSKQCGYVHRRNKIKRNCLYCGKEFLIKPSRLKYNLGKYCSAKCHHLNYGNLYSEENSHNWKGDNVGYWALHDWITRQKGRPSKCEDCGTTTAKKFEWANISGKYKREISDWKRLCKKCHIAFDGTHVFGEKCGPNKLTEKQVIKIRYLRKTYNISLRRLAKCCKVSLATIQSIVTRKTWKHI